MKTTLNLPEPLVRKAQRILGCRTMTEAIVKALEAVERREKLARLAREIGEVRIDPRVLKMRHAR